jgi:hypothetical protein
LKGSDSSLTEVVTWHLPGETEKNHEKISVRTAGAPAENRTEHLSNTNLDSYRYGNHLGKTLRISSGSRQLKKEDREAFHLSIHLIKTYPQKMRTI